MTPVEFIATIAPAARASMATSHIPASFVIAQAALESSWGRSKLALLGFNLFGVKSDMSWQGEVLDMPTREFVKGKWVTVTARWRKYPNWLACLEDHAGFLMKNPRYKMAFKNCHESEAFAYSIAGAGYATDPDYANKIISVIRAHGLKTHDTI